MAKRRAAAVPKRRAAARPAGAARRAASDDGIELRPLAAADWPALERLFGPNGACGGCWCMWWRVERGGALWERSKGEPNRRAFRDLVRAGRVDGVLALEGGEPVAWCCTGPRADFPRLERTKALASDWDEGTWSIACFYVPAKRRGQGLASRLLAATVELAFARGARRVEGYPVVARDPGAKLGASFAWTGVEKLFARAGFERGAAPKGARAVWLLERPRGRRLRTS